MPAIEPGNGRIQMVLSTNGLGGRPQIPFGALTILGYLMVTVQFFVL
jgi:hypothetical protein